MWDTAPPTSHPPGCSSRIRRVRTDRVDLTVRLSSDSGKTWPVSRLLNAGRSAYSNLAILPDGTIACLYERGKSMPYETITFSRFTMNWLLGGR